jgi:large subunit ribosomal protein L21
MVAVIEDLNSQYRVSEGDTIDVDVRDIEIGAQINFEKVCFFDGESGAKIGAPYVQGVKVTGTVIDFFRGPKVITAHFRRRKDSRSRKGHRQNYLRVKIDKIEA